MGFIGIFRIKYFGVCAELTADFLDDLGSRLADRFYGPGAEQEYDHSSQESADEDFDAGDVDHIVETDFTELDVGNAVQVGLEQQEGSKTGGDHGVTLG